MDSPVSRLRCTGANGRVPRQSPRGTRVPSSRAARMPPATPDGMCRPRHGPAVTTAFRIRTGGPRGMGRSDLTTEPQQCQEQRRANFDPGPWHDGPARDEVHRRAGHDPCSGHEGFVVVIEIVEAPRLVERRELPDRSRTSDTCVVVVGNQRGDDRDVEGRRETSGTVEELDVIPGPDDPGGCSKEQCRDCQAPKTQLGKGRGARHADRRWEISGQGWRTDDGRTRSRAKSEGYAISPERVTHGRLPGRRRPREDETPLRIHNNRIPVGLQILFSSISVRDLSA